MAALAPMAMGQAVEFETDAQQRGYYDRPWQRYEAEPSRCVTDGEFLLPPTPYTQLPLQAEASNQTALSLTSVGQYAEWTVDRAGSGLTLRFSLPDSADGKGTKGNFDIYINGAKVCTVEADSYWAWQYSQIAWAQDKYPDNTPADTKFARMRFDELCRLLPVEAKSGDKLRIVKADGEGTPYTIDFMELEPVAPALTFADIKAADKVEYDGVSDIGSFINKNGGKTIFIPAGKYSTRRRVTLMTAGTKVVGAGMWHTEIYFTADPNNRNTCSARGFESNVGECELSNLSLNTVNNQRYYNNNSAYQVGKGVQGSWGSDSRIADVRIQHFECGAWLHGANRLTVERCRMRNNYADGINLSGNSSYSTVSHCSFRNNGDDDMASWSTVDIATGNEFCYNTAENNWRASSLGFFGGKNHKAHHIAIFDGLEAGARATCDFAGTGFSTEGKISLSDISIYRCGAKQGPAGTQGGFWGDSAASLVLRAGYAYNLTNIDVRDIDIYDSRFDAVSIEANSGKRVENLELHNIHIEGVDDYRYGVAIGSPVRGSGHFSNLTAMYVVEPIMADIPTGFNFVEVPSGVDDIGMDGDRDPEVWYDLRGLRVDPATATGVIVGNGKKVLKVKR